MVDRNPIRAMHDPLIFVENRPMPAITAMQQLLAAHPDLQDFGFGVFDPRRKSREQREHEIAGRQSGSRSGCARTDAALRPQRKRDGPDDWSRPSYLAAELTEKKMQMKGN